MLKRKPNNRKQYLLKQKNTFFTITGIIMMASILITLLVVVISGTKMNFGTNSRAQTNEPVICQANGQQCRDNYACDGQFCHKIGSCKCVGTSADCCQWGPSSYIDSTLCHAADATVCSENYHCEDGKVCYKKGICEANNGVIQCSWGPNSYKVDSDENNSLTTLNHCDITSRTSIEGPPTITLDQFKEILTNYRSPALYEAKGIYDLGSTYNINPAFLLAVFLQESQAGTDANSISVRAKSIGNIRCSGTEKCVTSSNGNGQYRAYDTWTEGAKDWYRLIRDRYVNQRGLWNVETILPKYAPLSENATCTYIRNVLTRMNSWQ